MDPSLSGTIRFLFDKDGTKNIGLSGKADIGLAGMGYIFLY